MMPVGPVVKLGAPRGAAFGKSGMSRNGGRVVSHDGTGAAGVAARAAEVRGAVAVSRGASGSGGVSRTIGRSLRGVGAGRCSVDEGGSFGAGSGGINATNRGGSVAVRDVLNRNEDTRVMAMKALAKSSPVPTTAIAALGQWTRPVRANRQRLRTRPSRVPRVRLATGGCRQ
jgi:hypothetical protein